jgi:ABC-2 type transport system ATP-binding protein
MSRSTVSISGRRDVGRALRAHAAAGRTLLLSIHQIADAARVCDRFVLLSSGHVCGEGTLDELSAVASARCGVNMGGDLEEVFLALT